MSGGGGDERDEREDGQPHPWRPGAPRPNLPFMARSPGKRADGVADMSAAFDYDENTMPLLWKPHRPARPEKSEGGQKFKLVSDYAPAGDQPAAIAELVA